MWTVSSACCSESVQTLITWPASWSFKNSKFKAAVSVSQYATPSQKFRNSQTFITFSTIFFLWYRSAVQFFVGVGGAMSSGDIATYLSRSRPMNAGNVCPFYSCVKSPQSSQLATIVWTSPYVVLLAVQNQNQILHCICGWIIWLSRTLPAQSIVI